MLQKLFAGVWSQKGSMMTAATTAAIFVIVMVVVMVALAMIVTATGIMLVLCPTALPAAQNDKEKTGQ